MTLLDTLAPLRAHGKARTSGLPDATVLDFAGRHPQLVEAIEAAAIEYQRIAAEFPDLVAMDEDAQTIEVQSGFVNFYSHDAANPYIALSARGPWIVTLKGAVIYDTGGYGMLGLGHAPAAVIDAMAKPQAMANIMTPHVSQLRFAQAMKAEIGQTRGGCPYAAFLCLNSGSESVSLASRIVDANAKTMTDPGARHAGRAIKRLVVKGASTAAPSARAVFDSSRKNYVQHLASYRNEDSVLTVAPYDMDALRKVFSEAEAKAGSSSDVPGTGDGRRRPGRSVPVPFYELARELTRAHGSLLWSTRSRPPAPSGLPVHRRLPVSRTCRRRTGDLFQGAQRCPVPAVGAGGTAESAASTSAAVRQHHGGQSARAGRRLCGACAVTPELRATSPARQAGACHAGSPESRNRRPHHQGTGHWPAFLLRVDQGLQGLRHRLHRGMDARAGHRRDPWRRELAALHPALRGGRGRVAAGDGHGAARAA